MARITHINVLKSAATLVDGEVINVDGRNVVNVEESGLTRDAIEAADICGERLPAGYYAEAINSALFTIYKA